MSILPYKSAVNQYPNSSTNTPPDTILKSSKIIFQYHTNILTRTENYLISNTTQTNPPKTIFNGLHMDENITKPTGDNKLDPKTCTQNSTMKIQSCID